MEHTAHHQREEYFSTTQTTIFGCQVVHNGIVSMMKNKISREGSNDVLCVITEIARRKSF
jgi:hypothetical protein